MSIRQRLGSRVINPVAQDYRDFVVYNLHDSGEISEIEVNPEEVQKILDPKEVFMLVRQDMRRIYIWKGSVAPVRKRFISARRATLLQEDIRKSGGRALKIVSVDQGDEPTEFLDCFHLESMPVTEVLEDLRYVRNAERDAEEENPNVAVAPPEGSTAHGTAEEFLPPKKTEVKEEVSIPEVPETPPESEVPENAPPAAVPETPGPPKVTDAVKSAEPTATSGEPILFEEEEVPPAPAKEVPVAKPKKESKKAAPKEEPKAEPKRAPAKPKPAVRKVKTEPTPIPPTPAVPAKSAMKVPTAVPAAPISKAAEEVVLKEVLEKSAPEGTKRINIIIGTKLIGSIVQQKSILGKSIESTVWGEFEELPNGCAEVQGIVRIYTDQAKGTVLAMDLIQSDPNTKIELREDLKITSEKPDQILAEVSKVALPKGLRRLNVVLGSQLYGPVTQQKSVLGKSVEKLAWELISDLPGGCVELKGLIRIFVDAEKGIVKAVDILEGNRPDAEKTEEPAEDSPVKHRKLPEIPKGDN